ncbi:MAG: DUF2442 domain-containing protein [Clostridiales bacterium]|nr:DUF2442 domain-containing protein [Clostridiales bacterium]
MMQPKVISAKPLADYKVFIAFENGEKKVFDALPYISGDWFGKLREPAFFNTVRASGRTIEWAGGQDIAPHELYDNAVSV